MIFQYSKSPTHEQVPFQECAHKSSLFVKANKVSLGTQLTQVIV